MPLPITQLPISAEEHEARCEMLLDQWIDTALAIAGSLQVNLPQLQAYEGL